MTVTIIILALVLVLVIMYFSYNNKELALRKEAEAQEKNIGTVHDTMWKILKDKANVSEEYRKEFDKVYPEIIRGRYSDGSTGMKWIQESNPEFDTSLYADLMQAIEVQRSAFQNAQKRMLDILRQRETLIGSMPACWFIRNKEKIEYEPILSDRTNEVLRTRIDNETLHF